MTDLATRPSDPALQNDEPDMAHIVATPPGIKAAAYVLEAAVMGSVVEALCGEKLIPKRDPERLPLCPACKDIRDSHKALGGN
jgi:hypothetical protein